ncbi:class C sortase [Corynebacterium sanguinis]|uniref:class C sortase n=1 Tax=Corynebacterium sanguinis TaxID=2594913 RepID=UPI00223BD1C5|nr:class C sortase [Corynebacterium sanguinis]MCT2287741.1 class C sortase [Corynebacterium sanguinis]
MTEVQGRTASKHRRGPAKRSILLPVVLILAGVLVLLYPVVATQWNNHRQQGIAAEYARIQEETPPSVLQEQFEAATRYNQTKGEGPILDPWLSRITPDNAEWQEYMSYLGGDGVMARLVVPSAKIALPVYHGTSSSTLDKGVGHLFGTDLPVGGSGTHAVLTAHTGLTSATLFDNLDDVAVGDSIYIQVSGQDLKYQVDNIEIVLPEETDSLAPVAGEDRLTLITCTPYGINTHRLLVHSLRVPMDSAEGVPAAALQWQWWMWALLAAVAATLLVLLWWVIRERRKVKDCEPNGLS